MHKTGIDILSWNVADRYESGSHDIHRFVYFPHVKCGQELLLASNK